MKKRSKKARPAESGAGLYFPSGPLQCQRWGGIGPAGHLAVQRIQAFSIVAKEPHLLDHILSCLFFFALLLNKPIQKLHGPEILGGIGSLINRVDQAGNISLMLKPQFQHRQQRV